MPLFLTVWVVQMIVFHGLGLWFLWLDRTGSLARFKTRPIERRGYQEILTRVLYNQVFILLPAMAFMQWTGLAFVGAEHIGLGVAILSLAGACVGHDVVQ
jgi:hypothetical protein